MTFILLLKQLEAPSAEDDDDEDDDPDSSTLSSGSALAEDINVYMDLADIGHRVFNQNTGKKGYVQAIDMDKKLLQVNDEWISPDVLSNDWGQENQLGVAYTENRSAYVKGLVTESDKSIRDLLL